MKKTTDCIGGRRKKFVRRLRIVIASSMLLVAAVLMAHPWHMTPPVVTSVPGAGAISPTAMEKPVLWFKKTLGRGWQSPDGIAVDTKSGTLYMTDENEAVVRAMDSRGNIRVICDGLSPIFRRTNGGYESTGGLRMPEGIAFVPEGRLYLVEDIPGGRLIEFDLRTTSTNDRISGVVIDVPAPSAGYAWESVDVGPRGEILLAGSTLEAFMGGGGNLGFYDGVILYRDVDEQWWLLLNGLLDSYSAVCFAREGTMAYFASETGGSVGCIDLESHETRVWFSEDTFQSPEGVDDLPDGTVVVSTENGMLFRVDPAGGPTREVFDMNTEIESVVWDAPRQRLLVTSDQSGSLYSLEADWSFYASREKKWDVPFDAAAPVMVLPDECPDYLTGVLKMGGYDPFQPDASVSFREFARRVSLFAVDCDAEWSGDGPPVADPVQKVQFMVLLPQLFGVDMSGITGPVSGFVAVRKSGVMEMTRRVQGNLLHMDLWETGSHPLGQKAVALPFPFSARLSNRGVASIHFMGFGETPDYHMIINARIPDQSYMTVMHLNGAQESYRLLLPANKTIHHWVIGMKPDEPERWSLLPAP